MISRSTVLVLAEAYKERFAGPTIEGYERFDQRNKLYDFLYENDYDAWFCNKVKEHYAYLLPRDVKELVMKLHTGETQYSVTKEWTRDQREELGQRYLRDLAEDILNYCFGKLHPLHKARVEPKIKTLISKLELDGYIYRNNRLLVPESDVLDKEEEGGILKTLYASLGLDNKKTAFHHLGLSEKHYKNGDWDDSISNSRKFLECVLQEVAATHSRECKNTPLPNSTHNTPRLVREYLINEGLLEAKEKEALASIYGLLSESGGHPYMAENDQARLLRNLALTFSQFVMLRLDGRLRENS